MSRAIAKAVLMERAERIRHFYRTKGRMPSYTEIGNLVGLSSKATVARLVRQLHENELLDKDATGRLLPGRMKQPVRLLGNVEAGFPSSAEEENADVLSLDDLLIKNPQATFLLKVSGDSMNGAGIMQGDLVIVDRSMTAHDGNIVIAEVDGAWTMKRLGKVGKKITLLAENPKYPPIVPKRELKIAGVVTAVIRKYL